MHTILKIGRQAFLMRSAATAATVLKALSEAVVMDCKYSGEEHLDIYTPEQDRYNLNKLSIEVVRPSQVRGVMKKPIKPAKPALLTYPGQ